jgi:aminoglycoside phosphotransferase (APT) family kinase protein
MSLYLSASGPGFCLHEPLQSYSPRSRSLLEAIEATASDSDYLEGEDLVHFDYHLGNVLVHPDRPELVTAILDWDGARPGLIALDLAILAFDLTLRGPNTLQKRVEEQLIASTDSALLARIWAHASLRLVDWSIRHHGPQVTDHWLQVAEDHMMS